MAHGVGVGGGHVIVPEALGLGIIHADHRAAAGPHEAALIHADGMGARLLAIGQWRRLEFLDLLCRGVQLRDAAKGGLHEPDGAIGGGDHRVNAGGAGEGQLEVGHFSRIGVEPDDFIAATIIGDPDLPVAIFDPAPGAHAQRRGHVIFHIGDVHRLGAEAAHEGFVFRHHLRRFRLGGIVAEENREIAGEILHLLRRDAATLASHHRVAHVFDAIKPAIVIARAIGHAVLKGVAGLETGAEERILMAEIMLCGLGQEFAALIGRKFPPFHRALL